MNKNVDRLSHSESWLCDGVTRLIKEYDLSPPVCAVCHLPHLAVEHQMHHVLWYLYMRGDTSQSTNQKRMAISFHTPMRRFAFPLPRCDHHCILTTLRLALVHVRPFTVLHSPTSNHALHIFGQSRTWHSCQNSFVCFCVVQHSCASFASKKIPRMIYLEQTLL